MFDYDAALKMLLTERDSIAVQALSGWKVKRWHNTDLPRVRRLHVDLLGEISGGGLLHIELQSRNDPKMAVRMHEYGSAAMHKYGSFPEQLLIYVGRAPMRMPTSFRANSKWVFRYQAIDLRDFNGKKFLTSEAVGDNVLAILASHRDAGRAVRAIVGRIAGLEEGERPTRLEQLLTLAGLRKLGPVVEEEANRMPITEDILDHEIIGTAIKKGRRQGREEGREEGREQGREQGLEIGRREGQQRTLHRLIEKRFGKVPGWLEDRLAHASKKELDDLTERVLDAKSLEDLKT